QAFAQRGANEIDRAKSQDLAIAKLKAAVLSNPQFVNAFHALAEIYLKRGDRAAAVLVLKEDLKANPADAPAASLLIEILAGGAKPGAKPIPADLAVAKRAAAELTASDQQGSMSLAVAVAFHKVQALQDALPFALAAAKMLDTPPAHINLGDL